MAKRLCKRDIGFKNYQHRSTTCVHWLLLCQKLLDKKQLRRLFTISWYRPGRAQDYIQIHNESNGNVGYEEMPALTFNVYQCLRKCETEYHCQMNRRWLTDLASPITKQSAISKAVSSKMSRYKDERAIRLLAYNCLFVAIKVCILKCY